MTVRKTSPGSTILTFNAGSSSLKFALFDASVDPTAKMRGEIEDLDEAPHMIVRNAAGMSVAERRWPAGMAQPFAKILDALLNVITDRLGHDELVAVGHRVVHGGVDHVVPALVTTGLLKELEALTPLDPLHMPRNLAPIHAVTEARPALAQVVCFDTAFHRTIPVVAQTFALPRALIEAGVRRYGFHGLSFEYIARRLTDINPRLARKRVIIAHLGAGASLCALLDGRSMATTTGFSALDGLVMATRCGSLDPGVLLYLGRQGHSWDDIEDMLYRRSGLLGVSGVSSDLRVLAESLDPHAREAIDLFVYRLACQVSEMTGALEGLDGLVFTAGIGEHAPMIRQAVCDRLGWLGVRLDAAANLAGASCISAPHSAVDVMVIATDEETMIARHAWAVYRRSNLGRSSAS